MQTTRIMWTALASLALGAATNAFADRREDDGSNTPSNNALWTERESYRPVGVASMRPDVSRSNGEIEIDGTRGRSGRACRDRKSTRLNSSHTATSRMPSSA